MEEQMDKDLDKYMKEVEVSELSVGGMRNFILYGIYKELKKGGK